MKNYLLFTVFVAVVLSSTLYAQTQPPVIVNDTFSVKAGSTYIFNPLTNDYDPDGYNVYILSAHFNSDKGIIKKTEDTVITVFFKYDAKGFDSLSYIIFDEQNTVSSAGYVFFKIRSGHALDSLDVNNVGAKFCPIGNFFWDFRGISLYEVPAGSGKTTLFTAVPWIGGLDYFNALHLAGNRYSSKGNDYFKGPVRKPQAYFMASDSIWDRVWKITKAEIDYHKNHYWMSSYTMPEAIASWPGNGDTTLGEAFVLAPFFDKNGDGIYSPLHGDYPKIKGDQSVFILFNDAQPHSETMGMPLGIEIHQTAYAYDCQQDTAFDNTIFVHYDIYNRSANNYHNTFFAVFADFDIGYSYDDLAGCDTLRDSFFGYNAFNYDTSHSDPSNYGIHPPAQAVTFLSKKMTSFIASNNAGSYQGDPTNANEYYYYMQAKFSDSLHITYGGNGLQGDSAVNFMYPSDPWDSTGWNDYYTSGSFPYDRRGTGSIGPFNLNAGSVFSLDLAYVFARDMNGDNLSSVMLLKNHIDRIRWFYENDSTPCGGSFSGFLKEKEIKRTFKIYPVPAENYIWVENNYISQTSEYEIYNLSGQIVMHGLFSGRKSKINISALPSGLYIIASRNKEGIIRQKFLVNP